MNRMFFKSRSSAETTTVNTYLPKLALPLLLGGLLLGETALADAIGPLTPNQRASEAYKLRHQAAQKIITEPQVPHPNNGDEALPGKVNSYSKGLPHDANGVVDPVAYQALIDALSSGNPADFDNIPVGVGDKGLRNPQAAYTYLTEGKDPHALAMPAAPTMDSAQQASEAIEVMWQALTRDVPYANYDTDPLIAEAVSDMNHFSDFRGPKENGQVTTGTLFRGVGQRETVGPYISQFLLKPIPYGATTIEQKYQVPVAGNDHLTSYAEWLHIQNGGNPTGVTSVTFQTKNKYIYNGRAMAQFVLKDFVNMAYLGAARIIGGFGSGVYDPNDPYKNLKAEDRSPLFGVNHAIDYLSRVSMASQNVAWYQKWLVHRRARPEVFFGRVHNHITNPAISYNFHPELFTSTALPKVFQTNNTYLLPTATPNGSPLHPTYPAGHAVMAGAAITMLKAFFNGDFEIPNPVMPSANGNSLVAYNGPPLTIEGELNKLGSNISLGRDIAGVHYRTDGDWGMELGEAYAISVLQELVKTYNEDFAGFTFHKFDGTPMLISKI